MAIARISHVHGAWHGIPCFAQTLATTLLLLFACCCVIGDGGASSDTFHAGRRCGQPAVYMAMRFGCVLVLSGVCFLGLLFFSKSPLVSPSIHFMKSSIVPFTRSAE